MRRAARVDGNQREIVSALRRAGASVQVLSQMGQGVPDLLVARAGQNYLLEVKAGPHETLTPDEAEWHEAWRGQVCVVRSPEEALRAVGLL